MERLFFSYFLWPSRRLERSSIRALRDGTDLGYDRLGGCRKDNEQGEDGLPELVCILVAILYDTYMHSLANRARARAAHAAPLYRLVQLYV